MRLSVQVGDLEVNVVKALSPSDCPSTVFDLAAAELKAVIAVMDHSGFEVVDVATAVSSVGPPISNGRVSAARIAHALGCGQACSRLLNGKRADFPRDEGACLRPHYYVLIRDKNGDTPEAGYRVFTTWSSVQSLAQVRDETSGVRTLGPKAIFKGHPSQSEVDSFIDGFQQHQRILLNPALRSDDPS